MGKMLLRQGTEILGFIVPVFSANDNIILHPDAVIEKEIRLATEKEAICSICIICCPSDI
jgi:hypothetical protein